MQSESKIKTQKLKTLLCNWHWSQAIDVQSKMTVLLVKLVTNYNKICTGVGATESHMGGDTKVTINEQNIARKLAPQGHTSKVAQRQLEFPNWCVVPSLDLYTNQAFPTREVFFVLVL